MRHVGTGAPALSAAGLLRALLQMSAQGWIVTCCHVLKAEDSGAIYRHVDGYPRCRSRMLVVSILHEALASFAMWRR